MTIAKGAALGVVQVFCALFSASSGSSLFDAAQLVGFNTFLTEPLMQFQPYALVFPCANQLPLRAIYRASLFPHTKAPVSGVFRTLRRRKACRRCLQCDCDCGIQLPPQEADQTFLYQKFMKTSMAVIASCIRDA